MDLEEAHVYPGMIAMTTTQGASGDQLRPSDLGYD